MVTRTQAAQIGRSCFAGKKVLVVVASDVRKREMYDKVCDLFGVDKAARWAGSGLLKFDVVKASATADK